jgi:hypothetical protein
MMIVNAQWVKHVLMVHAHVLHHVLLQENVMLLVNAHRIKHVLVVSVLHVLQDKNCVVPVPVPPVAQQVNVQAQAHVVLQA